MKKLGLVLLALMSINIVACSNDENPFIERLDYEVEDEAQFAFKNSTSECADPDDCPSYVGSLYSFEKTETGV
ncbi:MAG: hypothetical protein KDD33_12645, partial [Bdellovibrionales bacterium]|nr:hypothetical protein [Bdellovibrionales bacterium]